MPPVQTRLPSHATAAPQEHTRPRSRPSSMSSFVHSPNPIHHSTTYQRQPHPYMVALSGWPEPVYISNHQSRSRPASPKQYGDGVVLSRPITPVESKPQQTGLTPTSPAAPSGNNIGGHHKSTYSHSGPSADSIFSRPCVYSHNSPNGCTVAGHPDHVDHEVRFRTERRQHKLEESNFPTSSARSTPHPSPPPAAGAAAPTIVSSPPAANNLTSPQASYTSRHSRFNDPRFSPNVAVLNRGSHLPIAPNWTSSPGSNPQPHHNSARLGVQVPAGQRGTGLLIMRSVPDVYPPPAPVPGMAGGMASLARATANGTTANGRVGVATEVYPRDPDRPVLWGGITPRRDSSTDRLSGSDD